MKKKPETKEEIKKYLEEKQEDTVEGINNSFRQGVFMAASGLLLILSTRRYGDEAVKLLTGGWFIGIIAGFIAGVRCGKQTEKTSIEFPYDEEDFPEYEDALNDGENETDNANKENKS